MRVSLVIPAYNAERTLERCLKAVAGQTRAPDEVLVVDDGSLDATREIAGRYARVITNTRTKGAAGARNTGMSAASGEIVAFTDSDCLPPPTWLENLLAGFDLPEIVAVGGGYSAGDGEGFWQQFNYCELAFRRRFLTGFVATLVTNNLAVKREFGLAVGGFAEKYSVVEDLGFCARIPPGKLLRWLPDNGVVHCFRESLAAYCRQQYRFAVESLVFFQKHPDILGKSNHQGLVLHGAIALAALLGLGLVGTAMAVAIRPALAPACFMAIATGLIAHFLWYIPFLAYLRAQKKRILAPAYLVSLLRDLLCGVPALVHAGSKLILTLDRK